MLTEIQGDLFSTSAPLIAHGVNCRGVFGAGVAKQIAERFPEAKDAYLEKHTEPGWRPGQMQVVLTCHPAVANLATQDGYGRRQRLGGPTFAHPDAIQKSIRRLLSRCVQLGIDRIAIPRIGCGLGGLDWEDVRPIIVRASDDFLIEVEVYSLD